MKLNLRTGLVLIFIFAAIAGCTQASNTLTPPSGEEPTSETKPSDQVIAEMPAGKVEQQLVPSPLVIQYSPAAGEEVKADRAVELTFDQAMDRKSVEASFTVVDGDNLPVDGTVSWKDDSHLKFTPKNGWPGGEYLEIVLADTASSRAGQVMAREFTSQFKTIAPLMVSQVFPADDTVDVDTTSTITVLFNRPVVPLETIEDLSKLAAPLNITPEVKGKGDWVSSGIYTFTPEKPLASDTQFTVTIPKGLKEVTGEAELALQDDFRFIFHTRKVAVSGFNLDNIRIDITYPTPARNASLLPKLGIQFTQEMDKTATNAAISITAGNKAVAPVRYEWSKDGKSVVVTPLRILSVDSDYAFNLDTTAKAIDGGLIDKGFSWEFHTIPAPYIISTYPTDNTDNVRESYFKIKFGTPMRGKTIENRVIFSPQPKQKISMYYYEGNYEAYFYGLEPSTDYTVKILPGMQDMFGNQINTGQEIHFGTSQLYASAYVNMPYNAIYRGDAPQEFFVNSTNTRAIHFKIYKVTPDFQTGYRDLYGTDFSAYEMVAEFDHNPEAVLNQNVLEKVKIRTRTGSKLESGAYILVMDGYEGNVYSVDDKDYRFFMITDIFMALKTGRTDGLAWAVDAASGVPVAGLGLDIFRLDSEGFPEKIGSGTTDKEGLLSFGFDPTYNTIYVTSSDSEPFTFAQTGWSQTVWLENFGYDSIYNSNEFQTAAYIYTDRPLYRPGQPVYFKGILRQDDDLNYLIPNQKEVEVVINSYDKEVMRKKFTLSASGTFKGEFMLDEEAVLGNYTLSVMQVDEPYNYINSIGFNVAEYHKPDYKVNLRSDQADVLTGGSFLSSLQADYYAGGALGNAAVDWTLSASPYFYTPPEKFSMFSFTPAATDDDWYAYRPEYESPRQLANGSTTTDALGHAEIMVPAKVADSKASQVLTFEATVTGMSGNPVSERISVNAHASELIAGIRPMSYVARAGEENTFQVVVLGWNGQPVSDQAVTVVISQRQWYSIQKENAQKVLEWETSVKDIQVARVNAKTGLDGMASVAFTPKEGGVYRAVVTVSDKGGRTNQSAAYMWVASEKYVSWRQSNDRTFQLVADKTNYDPGETAEVLIASPYQGEAYALVTVERGRIRKQEVVKLSGNSTLYKLPITEDMGPAVYLSVTVVKGMDDTNPYPSYKTGILRLNVSTESKIIQVEVVPDKKKASPGEEVTFTVKAKDTAGKPVRAEISLALVDLSSLALADANTGPIADFFYSLRGLSIHTALAHDLNIDEFNVQLNEMADGAGKGGGGDDKGGDIPGVMGVRKDFPDTAYWSAVVDTGEEGVVTVKVTLPGNLTTWRMDARAVTNDTLVGQTTVDILSNKPLMVQPVTPRFFIGGDKSQISALVTNNTDQDLTVAAKLDATGLDLEGADKQPLDIKAGQQAMVHWKVSVPVESSRVDVILSVEGGGYEDASLAPLGTLDNQGIPVYRYEVPESVGVSGILREAGIRTEGVSLPGTDGPMDGNVRIELEPSLVNGLENGVGFLNDYPYRSMDVTVSEFLSAIALRNALAVEGKQDTDTQKKVDDLISKGLQRIYARQNIDGGWGWWSDNDSDPVTSAYVMIGLAKLKESDRAVTQSVTDRAAEYLKGQIDTLKNSKNMPLVSRLNRETLMLYALTMNQYTQSKVTNDLYENRKNLSYYSQALLLQVLDEQNHSDKRIQTLLADLISSASLSAGGASWDEKSRDWWNWSTDTRTTAIVLQTLIRLDDQNPLVANGVRWLMNHRVQGRWWTTQETAWSLMALSDWMMASRELQGNYNYIVTLNEDVLLEGQVTPENITESREVKVDIGEFMRDQVNRLSFTRGTGDGAMYYSTYMTVNLPVSEIEPLDQGLSLTRKYYSLDDPINEITSAENGDILRASLTIVVPQALHYVTIEDPLPAGMEAVDSSLKTSPQGLFDTRYNWFTPGLNGWGWWYFSHSELRDEKVVLFSNWLPAGTYVYDYFVRATTPGQYQVIPPHGQETYFPDVYGRGAGSEFVIE